MNHSDNFKTEVIIPGSDEIKWQTAIAIISPNEHIQNAVNDVIKRNEDLDITTLWKITASAFDKD